MAYIDIHTHQVYSDNTMFIYNAYLDSTLKEKYISVGIHPWYVDDLEFQIAKLESLLNQSNNIKAIGECGLDKLCNVNFDLQLSAFKQQIKLASRYKLPLIIHCVKAYNECLSLLKHFEQPVIFHGFNKNEQLAHQLIESGYYLSLGNDMFLNSNKYKHILTLDNLSHVFLETDDIRIHIKEIYEIAAKISDTHVDNVILHIQNNYNKIFL